jgi:HlyD family secretion protein
LERDKANLDQAKVAFEHREVLRKRRAISQNALNRSRTAYEQVQAHTKFDEAEVARLQAALNAAESNLGYTDIIAPIDGMVVSRNVEIGQTVASGSEAPPLFLIATDPSTVK